MAKRRNLFSRADFRDKVSSKFQDFLNAYDREMKRGDALGVDLVEDQFLESVVNDLVDAQQNGYLTAVQDRTIGN